MPNQTYSKVHSHIWHHLHLTESISLYTSHTIRTFAQSMIGIFIPIFIFTMEDKPTLFSNDIIINSILWVLLFYSIRSVGVLLLMPTMTNLVFEKLKFKWSIFLSTFILAITVMIVSKSEYNAWLLLLAASFFSIQTILYWIPYHILFIRKTSTDHGHFGKKFGSRLFLTRVASALGPFIGGFIIMSLGFNVLFLTGIIIILVSAFPIIFSVHEHKHYKHSAFKIFKNNIVNPRYFPETISLSATAIDDNIYSIFWPIVLLLALGSFAKVGSLTSLSLVISSLMALQTGKFIDRHGAKLTHKIGLTFNSLLYVPRLFPLTPISVTITDILDRINGSLYGIPFNSVMYEHAKSGKHDSNFIIYREMIMHVAILCVLIPLFFIIPILPSIKLVFLIPIFVSPFAYFIHFDKSDRKEK